MDPGLRRDDDEGRKRLDLTHPVILANAGIALLLPRRSQGRVQGIGITSSVRPELIEGMLQAPY
jgi:hypothetical protein